MSKSRKPKKNELLDDYRMLEKMSKDLVEHQKKIKMINRNIAKKLKSNMRFGLVDNLEITLDHMDRAQKEIDKAKKELKMI